MHCERNEPSTCRACWKTPGQILLERAMKVTNVLEILNLVQLQLCCFQDGKENTCTNTQFALITSVNKQACRVSKKVIGKINYCKAPAANCIHAITLKRCWFCISKVGNNNNEKIIFFTGPWLVWLLLQVVFEISEVEKTMLHYKNNDKLLPGWTLCLFVEKITHPPMRAFFECGFFFGYQVGSVKRKNKKSGANYWWLNKLRPNQAVRLQNAVCLQRGNTEPDSWRVSLETPGSHTGRASLSLWWPNTVQLKIKWMNK